MENQQQLIEAYLDAFNRFDVDGMLAQLDPQVVFAHYSNGECSVAVRGLDEFRKIAEQARAMLSERKQDITSMRIEGDQATLGVIYQARLASDIPSGGKAGETLQLKGKSVYRFANGKISSIADYS